LLLKLLEGLQEDNGNGDRSTADPDQSSNAPTSVCEGDDCTKIIDETSPQVPGQDQPERKRIGIGVDCCILPLRHGNLSLIQTTDFFYPLVEDPFMQGRIACANVLSDLYAMGVTDCDNVELICGIPTRLSDEERDIVIGKMLEGFRDCAKEGGAMVRGGQIAPNPWMMIGGVASSVCSNDEFISPDGACVGDVLILTKPLGTQIAVNAHQWMDQKNEWWDRISNIITPQDCVKAFQRAAASMSRLNRVGARLMKKHGAHCATDVTGYGILGHAANMAKVQKNEVEFVIDNLPIIAKMVPVAKTCGIAFGLLQGYSAETSGGLLLCIPKETADAFVRDIHEEEGLPAWVVGEVVCGGRTARIIDNPRITEVPSVEREEELW